MDNITNFDVLIVYSEKLAFSANSVSKKITAPFAKRSDNESYNLVYSYFLETCRKNSLIAAFTTSADIVGAGLVRSYWLFENETWLKVRKIGFSKLIFDKFSPLSKRRRIKRNLLFSSKRIKSFNNPHLFDLFFDKQKTYDRLDKFSIPTVAIEESTRQGVIKARKLLRETMASHEYKYDFSKELIMKDRFGAGGNYVYKFKNGQIDMMVESIKEHKTKSFIIQPFVKFNKGFSYKNSLVSTDIRLIYIGKKIVQTYIRVAEKQNFICNEHAGGLLKYISKSELPSKVVEVSRKIAEILDQKNSLFSLDFIISNKGNIYLLEANTGPGLDWNLSVKENEIEAKKLIRIIIKEIVRRVDSSSDTFERKTVATTTNTPKTDKYPILPNTLTTI